MLSIKLSSSLKSGADLKMNAGYSCCFEWAFTRSVQKSKAVHCVNSWSPAKQHL